jgi:Flp pilus assembly pilin Flp
MMKAISAPYPMKKTLRQRGEGVAEYIIVVALIAVASIGVYSMFGKAIHRQVAGLTGEVTGVEVPADEAPTMTAASDTTAKAAKTKSVASYEPGAPAGMNK